MKIDNPPGATALDPDELLGLLPQYISTQGELNQLESDNILEARVWALGSKKKDVLTDTFIKKLHKRMFKDVWRWAGQYRRSDKNIGVAYEQIGVEVFKLCGDTRYWIDHKTYDWKELGARFHHKLVSIHPFPNGNGRHARLMTDVLMMSQGQQLFSWGAGSKTRDQYLDALREADRGRIAKLIEFAL